MGASIEVVLDAPTIAAAVGQLGPGVVAFPKVPPRTGMGAVDALGVFAFTGDRYFAHILSEEIVKEASQVLTEILGWHFDEAREVLNLVYDQAEDSGGGLVRPEHRISVPGNVQDSTKTAIRAAATKDVGFPRLVVTSDPAALHIETLQPHGIPFPKDEAISFGNPDAFAEFAREVRQDKRRVPPRH